VVQSRGLGRSDLLASGQSGLSPRQSCYYVNSVISAVYYLVMTIISPATPITADFAIRESYFHFVRLLAIYLFMGTLPTVYYSATLLILPRLFFPFDMFRKALLMSSGNIFFERGWAVS
jgi:hypothetical protein